MKDMNLLKDLTLRKFTNPLFILYTDMTTNLQIMQEFELDEGHSDSKHQTLLCRSYI